MGPRPAPTQSATRASPSGRGRLETYTPQPSAVTKTHPTARPGVRTARDQGRREISVRKTTARPLQRSCASYASVREGLEAGPHPGAGVSVPDPFSRAPSSSYRRYFCTTGETWACPCERSARISSLDLLSLLQRSTGVGSLADLWQQMLQLGPHLQGRARQGSRTHPLAADHRVRARASRRMSTFGRPNGPAPAATTLSTIRESAPVASSR